MKQSKHWTSKWYSNGVHETCREFLKRARHQLPKALEPYDQLTEWRSGDEHLYLDRDEFAAQLLWQLSLTHWLKLFDYQTLKTSCYRCICACRSVVSRHTDKIGHNTKKNMWWKKKYFILVYSFIVTLVYSRCLLLSTVAHMNHAYASNAINFWKFLQNTLKHFIHNLRFKKTRQFIYSQLTRKIIVNKIMCVASNAQQWLWFTAIHTCIGQ